MNQFFGKPYINIGRVLRGLGHIQVERRAILDQRPMSIVKRPPLFRNMLKEVNDNSHSWQKMLLIRMERDRYKLVGYIYKAELVLRVNDPMQNKRIHSSCTV